MSKFFRVATEGATTDGRAIQRDWITQMAKNYKPATYGARVWMEHIRGVTADSAFAALGDVLAVEARTVEDGKLALFAQIEALPQLVAINKAKQKIYTSIEVDPDFAKSGEAYLTGLGVTDTPASLGTEVLKFAAANPEANPFAAKKSAPGALFTAAIESDLGIAPEADNGAVAVLAKFTDKLGEMITSFRSTAAPKSGQVPADFAEKAVEALSAADGAIKHQATELSAARTSIGTLTTDLAKLQTEFKTLAEKLSKQDGGGGQRPEATGNEAAQVADC